MTDSLPSISDLDLNSILSNLVWEKKSNKFRIQYPEKRLTVTSIDHKTHTKTYYWNTYIGNFHIIGKDNNSNLSSEIIDIQQEPDNLLPPLKT